MAHGITSASLVASVRNGQIVDDMTLDIFKDVLIALKEMAAALEQIEARIRILER